MLRDLGTILDIVLESGAGPTVRRSMKDRTYFSTVVQISLLTLTHELNFLSRGLPQVLEHKMERKEPNQRNYCTYDALLGTLRACKERTVSFPWDLQLQAIEDITSTTLPNLRGFPSRNLPVCILEGCLDFLRLAQTFPEDNSCRLRDSSGLGT